MKCSMEETKERSQPCYSGTSKILVERHLTHDVPFPHPGNRLVIRQKICYHTRVKSKGASGVSRYSPDPHNPRGAHPTVIRLLGRPGEVSLHQMSCHFPSIAWRRWVT